MDLSGLQFGRYSVVGLTEVDAKRGAMWRCQCSCGSVRVVAGHDLRRGTKSCGCLHHELLAVRNTMHGATGSYAFRVWTAMKRRCGNPRDISYRNYGALGVVVCDRWRNDFAAFVADMGAPPSRDYSIDRYPNKSGNYEPDNCRWATRAEQARNKRTNVRYSYHGKSLLLEEISAACGVPQSTLRRRLIAGLPMEMATKQGRLGWSLRLLLS